MTNTRLILPEGRISPLARLSRHLSTGAYDDSRFFIFVDENTYTHCLAHLVSHVERLQEAEFVELPVGEECKCAEVASQVWQTLLESGADRQSVIVNLGGGCVSDLGGFVASTYMRGIRHINVPTTLVAMVDAAIGGKTAINLGSEKNMAGTFAMPQAVCIDPVFLETLPDIELRSGAVELLKTLVVGGAIDTMPQGGWEELLSPVNISACANIKSAIVRHDPFDRSVRHILNFGHTFGHAIEAYSHAQRQPLPHGLAVGAGMVCALYLSVHKLGLPMPVLERYRQWIGGLMMLPHYTLRDTEALLSFMHHDKKNHQGSTLCVLLQDIGSAVIDVEVSDIELRDALLQL